MSIDLNNLEVVTYSSLHNREEFIDPGAELLARSFTDFSEGGVDDISFNEEIQLRRQAMSDSDVMILAVDRGRSLLAGIALLEIKRSLLTNKYTDLRHLAVQPELRSLGIGSAILTKVKEESIKMKCAKVSLTSLRAPHSLYFKNGFKQINPYDDPSLDRLGMTFMLPK